MGFKTPSSILSLLATSLFLFNRINCAVIRPSSNPNYIDAPNAANGTVEPFTIWQTTTVKVHANDTTTGQQWSATFYPRIDEFTVFELTGSYNTSMTFDPKLTIWLEFYGRNLTAKRIAGNDTKIYMPYQVGVVLLSGGYISSFEWQDGCGNCRNKYCIDNQCGTDRYDGNTDVCTQTDCNIKIYFAWSGRDSNDNACKSIASTPEKFAQFSLSPTANFGNGLYNDFIYTFRSTAPDPTDT